MVYRDKEQGHKNKLRPTMLQLYNSSSLTMGYNSGPSGTTDKPTLNPQIRKKAPRLRPQGDQTGKLEGMCQGLDTKEEERAGKVH
jgi:hypothetical protein